MFDNISKSSDEKLSEVKSYEHRAKVFLKGVINSLREHVAVIDKQGNIIAVNDAWKKFARENGADQSLILSSGINYLEVCRCASGDPDKYAEKTFNGIKDILEGNIEVFEMEYPCPSPDKQRWFLMTVVPLRRPEGGAVVTHADITWIKQVEDDLRKSRENLKKKGKEYQDLSRKLISSRENARRSLARELHDSFSQRLAMISMLAARIEMDNAEEEKLADGLKRIRTEIGSLSEDVHDIAKQLHPRILEDLGLRHAVESLCESVTNTEGIPFEIKIGKIPEEIPLEKALNIYRIIQESISNVFKHASADKIWLNIETKGNNINISIKDDGSGFDPDNIETKKRLGLVVMRERAVLIGGDLYINSKKGSGTEIILQVPLSQLQSG